MSLWLADGTNYPGQDDLRGRFRHLVTGLHELYAALPDGVRLLVEYKFFEPAFYATDLPDWGTAALVCRRLGPQAQVLVDTGHHALGTNIEQIVALLLEEGLLGGFHFNNRKYADDDLIAGSVDPFELFRIMNEIVAAKLDPSTASTADEIAFMIDQSHNVEGKLEAMIRSVVNIQTAFAKALLVDREQLRDAQNAGDVLAAHGALVDAYETDVRPLLVALRAASNLPPDPLEAFRSAGTPSGSHANGPRPRTASIGARGMPAGRGPGRARPPTFPPRTRAHAYIGRHEGTHPVNSFDGLGPRASGCGACTRANSVGGPVTGARIMASPRTGEPCPGRPSARVRLAPRTRYPTPQRCPSPCSRRGLRLARLPP